MGKSIEQERVERWANEIVDLIRKAQQDEVLGNMIGKPDDVNAKRTIFFQRIDNKGWEIDYCFSLPNENTKNCTTSLMPQKKPWSKTEGIDGDNNYTIEKIVVSADQLSLDAKKTSSGVTWYEYNVATNDATATNVWSSVTDFRLIFENEKKSAEARAIASSYEKDRISYSETYKDATKSLVPNIASYRITLRYKDTRRYIYGNVYSGNVEIKTQEN